MKIFYKVIYYLRNKFINIKISYLRNELQVLFPDRISLGTSIIMNKFPSFIIDQSNSKIKIDNDVIFLRNIRILCYDNAFLKIGTNTIFNDGCSINCLDNIEIGDNCLLGENVKLYDHNHKFSNYTIAKKDQGYNTAPIIIGNNVWIGSNVTILKGVSIGDNAVIGAGCTISQNIPSNSLVKEKNNLIIENIAFKNQK